MMNRLYTSDDYSISCTSESDNGLSSDDEDIGIRYQKDSISKSSHSLGISKKIPSQNILLKLQIREKSGYFTNKLSFKDKKPAFERVPRRLHFCLKQIVPYCYLTGHIFMGLTICGQFMLSYKIISDEDSAMSNYSFTSSYRYELYFWIYRPHNLLHKYFTITVFDDHGVDNIKVVTISQWKSNPQVLIVHGSGGNDGEDSYVSIVAVPNLSCLECKKQRDEFYSDSMDGSNRTGYLCIKCNFTIHTKYCRSDTDPIFEPIVNLQCVNKLLIVANGLIHMVHIDLNINKQPKSLTNTIDIKYVRARTKPKTNTTEDTYDSRLSQLNTAAVTASKPLKCFDVKMMELATTQQHQIQQEPKNIVEKIIADFAECETDLSVSDKQQQSRLCNQRNFNELIITCRNNVDKPETRSKVRLLNHRSNRIISKNVNENQNSITTIDLNGSMQSCSNGINKTFDKAAKAYEFSEDNEKCEKISTFRKRRLADKKYEFSEDNTENIIPYNRMRTVIRNATQIHSKIRHSPAHTNVTNYGSSPPSAYEFSNSYHTHRASPSFGFRSPCGSPVGNRLMMSPPARSCFSMKSPPCTRSSAMSPRSMHSIKRTHYDSILDSNHVVSLQSDDCDMTRTNITNGTFPLSEVKPSNIDLRSNQPGPNEKIQMTVDDKPMCSIKLIRHYVEEDDAASVITSEEDDCISPGYHTSLPLEVHGAGYSDMQMISKNSSEKLMCPTIIVTQTTFDLEAFTYYVVNYVCSMNNKKYGFFFDCGCEIVKVCPLSCILTCILMVNFTASDLHTDSSVTNCINCSSKLNLDCAFHQKHYECQILFTWDVDTGEWNVLDYGHLKEVPTSLTSNEHAPYIHRIMSKLATEMISNLTFEMFNNLHVLDSCVDKSKKILRDADNSIEFHRQLRYSSDLSDFE